MRQRDLHGEENTAPTGRRTSAPACAPKTTGAARFWNIDAIFYAISYSHAAAKIEAMQTNRLFSAIHDQYPEILGNGIRHASCKFVTLSFSSCFPILARQAHLGETLKMGFFALP
ncbi:MAG: hypothetical protein WBE72_15110 [Terracidiphilus sp.]